MKNMDKKLDRILLNIYGGYTKFWSERKAAIIDIKKIIKKVGKEAFKAGYKWKRVVG